MAAAKSIERVPWDSAALGCEAYELQSAAPGALAQVRAPGHYTIRVDPLADKRILDRTIGAVHRAQGVPICGMLREPRLGAGLARGTDRGEIAAGKRADLILVANEAPARPRIVAAIANGRIAHLTEPERLKP